MPKVDGRRSCLEVSGVGRKMDVTVPAWPSAFINNAVPITLGTSLDAHGVGNYSSGLFKTASIISHTHRIFECSEHPLAILQ